MYYTQLRGAPLHRDAPHREENKSLTAFLPTA